MSSRMRWALATLSGCLNGAAFIYYGPLTLIANVPLLWALWSTQNPNQGARLGAWVGFLGGIHIFGVLSYGWWIFWAFSIYTASQMTLFGWLISKAQKDFFNPQPYLKGWRSHYFAFLPALIWTLTEWLRTIGPLALPASYVGCIADVAWLNGLLSWASFGGGLWVSMMIAWCASGIAILGAKYFWPVYIRVHVRVGLVPLVITLLCGVWGVLLPNDTQGIPLKVAALQGGFSNAHYQAADADPALSREIIATYRTLLERARYKEIGLMIWAESAIRVPLLTTPALQKDLFPRSDESFTIIGGLAHTDPDGRTYNLAVALERGRLIDRYAKVKTVPGVEARFTPGLDWKALETQWGKIGVLICFESIYPHAGRALVLDQAKLLVILSNDAGFGETPISHHMNNRAIVRAVELGRWLVRVGQAGVTSLVSPTGEVIQQLGLFEAGMLEGEVKLRDEKTGYVRWGLGWLWLLILGLFPLLQKKSTDNRALDRPSSPCA